MQEHHVLFSRKLWNAQGATKALRNEPSLRPRIPKEEHVELHRQFAVVPPPCHFMADRMLRYYKPTYLNPIAAVDNLMFAVEEAIASPKIKEMERSVGCLIIQALEIQKPYLEEGRFR